MKKAQASLLGIIGLIFVITVVFLMYITIQAGIPTQFDSPKEEVNFFIGSSYELGLRCFLQQIGKNDGNLVFNEVEDLEQQGISYLLKTQEVLPQNFSIFKGREIKNLNENLDLILLDDKVNAFLTKDFQIQIDNDLFTLQTFSASVPVRLRFLLDNRDVIKKVDPLQKHEKDLDLGALRDTTLSTKVFQKDFDSVIEFNDEQSLIRNVPYKFIFVR
tara:strand:- start:581 stop:1231 length:651 start_codon:yes stop_codon:yes gene_type:complete